MKLLVDSLLIFVVMLLAAGAIAQGEPAKTEDNTSRRIAQDQSDAKVALLVNLLDW